MENALTSAQDTFASHLKTAHTALFDLLKRCSGDLTHASYTEAGISLQIVPGVAARATAKPFCGANGQFVPGLELTVPDVGTASYLLLDAITAVQSGELDEVINNNKSVYAHIDAMDGYPKVVEWLHE
jgi:hypothetical protein